MSKPSVTTVVDESVLPTFPGTIRKITAMIDSKKHEMIITKPDLKIGNGNQVVWEVGGITDHLVEIDLGKPSVSSLVQAPGTTEVRGHVNESMESGGKVPYSVFLRKIGETSRTELKHVTVLTPLATGVAPGPYLVIDRMGDPSGDPDMCPPDTHACSL